MIDVEFLRAWVWAFVFTQVVEIPIYAYALRVSLPIAFGASALTHPIVWFGFFHPIFDDVPYWPRVIAAEHFAWLAEAAYLHFGFKIKPARALLWALIANAASVLLGFASRAWLGLP